MPCATAQGLRANLPRDERRSRFLGSAGALFGLVGGFCSRRAKCGGRGGVRSALPRGRPAPEAIRARIDRKGGAWLPEGRRSRSRITVVRRHVGHLGPLCLDLLARSCMLTYHDPGTGDSGYGASAIDSALTRSSISTMHCFC